jgi:hypothetical protein
VETTGISGIFQAFLQTPDFRKCLRQVQALPQVTLFTLTEEIGKMRSNHVLLQFRKDFE